MYIQTLNIYIIVTILVSVFLMWMLDWSSSQSLCLLYLLVLSSSCISIILPGLHFGYLLVSLACVYWYLLIFISFLYLSAPQNLLAFTLVSTCIIISGINLSTSFIFPHLHNAVFSLSFAFLYLHTLVFSLSLVYFLIFILWYFLYLLYLLIFISGISFRLCIYLSYQYHNDFFLLITANCSYSHPWCSKSSPPVAWRWLNNKNPGGITQGEECYQYIFLIVNVYLKFVEE